MKKAWSLSTTVRNPERILPFLRVLSEMEGQDFDVHGQVKFQTLIIKHRLYKPTKLPAALDAYYDTPNDTMLLSQAEEIFNFMKSKSAELTKDPGLRGRTSVAPLTKMGLAIAKKTAGEVIITSFGKAFLNKEIDLGDVFFRFFLKWQIPNPETDDFQIENGYDIKPFIGTLQLIKAVNEKSIAAGEKEKGLSKQEFSLFVPTLVDYKDINRYADKILNLRNKLKGKSKPEQKAIFDEYKASYAVEFLGKSETKVVNKFLNNLKDYGDNTIRYLRLTRFVYIRGGGFYIDLEPRREIEIINLLGSDNGRSIEFSSSDEYLSYLSDYDQPVLPWETSEKLQEIVGQILDDIRYYEKSLDLQEKELLDYSKLSNGDLKKHIAILREYRRDLQEIKNHSDSQSIEKIEEYVNSLRNIYSADDRAVALEKYVSLGLHALNDALKIQPNYPVGDDNEPTFTAPAGKPDIECFYNSYNAICEVTMLTGRDQWYNEGQPIMRHLRDFEVINDEKQSYCIFVSPSIHRDTLNTFWISVKYEYEGKPQKIVPLTIENFILLLKTLIEIKKSKGFLSHKVMENLFNAVINNASHASSANDWFGSIPETITSWQKSLTR
jgi:hypothetical protein